MPVPPGVTPACPDTDGPHRLAGQLTDMVSGAATCSASLNDPTQEWPHTRVIAKDAAREATDLSRTASRVAACRILRVSPYPDRRGTYPFAPVSTPLTRSDLAAASRGR